MNGQRVKVGISGLDDMLGGGLLAGSICAIIGNVRYPERQHFPSILSGRGSRPGNG